MIPQSSNEQQAAIAQMVQNKMGGQPPQPQGQPQGQPGMQAPMPPQGPPPEAPPTPAEKMDAQGSPKTEGDQMDEDPVLYAFKRGDEEVKLTPKQLEGMYERYERLVDDYSQYGAFNEMGRKLMSNAPPGMRPEQAIDELIKRAMQHNPQMGQQQQPDAPEMTSRQAPSNVDVAEQLAKWEQENAVSLPPGYKEMMQGGQGMTQQMAQMQQMLQQVLAQSAGVANAAKMSAQGGISQAANLQKQRIQNNIGEVFQRSGMAEQDAQDFNVFAAERGYTPIDFASKNLLAKLVQDYQANKNSPEMQRMKDIHQRRQAFTGRAVGATPQPGGMSGQQPSGPLAEMIQSKVSKRFG